MHSKWQGLRRLYGWCTLSTCKTLEHVMRERIQRFARFINCIHTVSKYWPHFRYQWKIQVSKVYLNHLSIVYIYMRERTPWCELVESGMLDESNFSIGLMSSQNYPSNDRLIAVLEDVISVQRLWRSRYYHSLIRQWHGYYSNFGSRGWRNKHAYCTNCRLYCTRRSWKR